MQLAKVAAFVLPGPALLFAALALGTPASAPLAGDPILELHASSLTAYLGAASSVQDIWPVVGQRGTNIDGSLRAAPMLPFSIAGNPFGEVWGGASHNGINLSTGHAGQAEVDIALPAPGFSWIVGRSHNAVQETSTPSYRDSSGYQGVNWFQNSQPELVRYRVNGEQGADDDGDMIYLVYRADAFAEYKRIDIAEGTSDDFRGVNGAAGVFTYVAGDANNPDLFVLTDQRGYEFTFFGWDGFDSGDEVCAGQLWKITDEDSNVAYVGSTTDGDTAISSGFNSSGYITKAYDTADRRYTYTYTTLDSTDRLTEVKAETKTGGTWASPTGLATVAEVDYEYYSTESYGEIGDLKLVEITTPLTDSAVSSTRKKLFRYWEGAYSATTNPGHEHAIKLILGFEGTRGYDWQDDTFDEDFLTASHSTLEEWADAYYEYDSSHLIDLTWTEGNCGCGGGANGTHEIEYETNGSYTDNSGYDTTWMARTIVDKPNGSYVTHYFDEAHQGLSRVVTDADPDNTSPVPDRWATEVTRDSSGFVTDIHTPANTTGYTHSTGVITNSTTAGLVRTFTRITATEPYKHFVTYRKWQEGTSGTEYLDEEILYEVATVTPSGSDGTVYRPYPDSRRVYSERITSGTTGSRVTTRTDTFHSSTLARKKVTTTLPTVTTANNGSNSSDTASSYREEDERVILEKSGLGHITYREYTNGQLTKLIEDADTDSADVTIPAGAGTDFDDADTGDELHRKTTYAYDAQGRPTTTTLPDGRVTLTYYSRLADQRLVTISYPKYVSGTPSFYGPASFTVTNHAGQVEAQGTVAISGGSTTTALTGHVDETDDDPVTALDLGTVAQIATSIYTNTGGEQTESRTYFSVPSTLPGTDGTHYDATLFGYDDEGHRWRTKDATGTIRRTVFDTIGRVASRWIGTNDSTFSGGESSGTDNMVKTEELEYDGDADDGNGLVTERTLHEDDSGSSTRVTSYEYDARGNLLLQTNPTAPHAFHKYDNLDRRIATGLFSSTASITATSDDPTTETTNRMALSETAYDELGRVVGQIRHKIDPDDGSDDQSYRTASNFFDADGNLIKTIGSQNTKTFYDGLGRPTHRFAIAKIDDTVYADADDVSGDFVMEESRTHYDGANPEVLMRATISRLHDDGIGGNTGALDSNADSDDLLYTAANLGGRIQITCMWYDSLGRLEDQVAYGTYGGSNFDRDGLSVPSRSDTALRTTYTYNTDGTLQELEDPKALETRFEYDAAGRKTKEIRNYGDGTPSGTDSDQTVKYEYTDGLLTKLTADVPAGGTDQDTTYTYGTTKGASAGDSKIATGHLLQEAKYPDSASASDVVSYAYNALSEKIWMEDQEGNVIETGFDGSGRSEHRRITTLDADFDGDVRRISTTYDSLGRRQLVTQYDNATVGSGSVVDEVKFAYDKWGNVSTFEQDRNSAVDAVGSVDDYEVSYTYEDKFTSGHRASVRRSTITLPSGNVITYSYGTNRIPDCLSRVSVVTDGGVDLAAYRYLGAGMVVGTDYPQPDVMSETYTTTSGDYADLDRFNRVTTSKWTKDLATDVEFYDLDITYDRNSNITLVEDNVHAGFDVSYTNDSLDRLTDAQEGTWNGSSITSETRQQDWTLDHLGNWDASTLDLNGDGDYLDTDELDEVRTHNDVNELTARDIDDDSTDDYTLTYDAVGNLTDDGESYKYTWDPFGRLREVLDRSDDSLVAEFTYNGLGFRIGVHEDTDRDGDVDGSDLWYYTAYDERWRALATFRDDDTDPKEEFVPHQAGLDGRGGSSYIDLVICRDKDANTAWTSASDGTLEERGYYCQNWRADVVALVGSDSMQWEQDRYSAYGVPFGLPGGDADSDGDCDATDVTQVQTWIDPTYTYDVRGDIDLDGDVDATDKSTIQSSYQGQSLAREYLSSAGNLRSIGGQPLLVADLRDGRNRKYPAQLGRWLSRDPAGYIGQTSLYEQVGSNPIGWNDPMGLTASRPDYISAVSTANTSSGWKNPWSTVFQGPGTPLMHTTTAEGECPLSLKVHNGIEAADPLQGASWFIDFGLPSTMGDRKGNEFPVGQFMSAGSCPPTPKDCVASVKFYMDIQPRRTRVDQAVSIWHQDPEVSWSVVHTGGYNCTGTWTDKFYQKDVGVDSYVGMSAVHFAIDCVFDCGNPAETFHIKAKAGDTSEGGVGPYAVSISITLECTGDCQGGDPLL